MHRKFLLCVGILAVLMAASPLFAHHGWAGNSEDEFELTGVVDTPLSLAGPHATMKIRSEGKVWDLTLAPPSATERSGLKEGMIPVGATVSIHGHRSMDANKYEVKTERVTWNNKTFNVYPARK